MNQSNLTHDYYRSLLQCALVQKQMTTSLLYVKSSLADIIVKACVIEALLSQPVILKDSIEVLGAYGKEAQVFNVTFDDLDGRHFVIEFSYA